MLNSQSSMTVEQTSLSAIRDEEQRRSVVDGFLSDTYDFTAGTSGSVTIARHAGSNGSSTVADAVKFVPTASSVTINNAHYFVWSAMDGKPYLVNIDIDGATLEYYAFDDGDADNVVEDGELTQTATPPADVVTGRSPAEEQQNFANWYSFYRKRELTATAAVSNVIANMQGVQIGIRTINGNVVKSALKIKVGPVDETSTLLTSLYSLTLSAQGTPLRTGLQRVGQYFDQTDGDRRWHWSQPVGRCSGRWGVSTGICHCHDRRILEWYRSRCRKCGYQRRDK